MGASMAGQLALQGARVALFDRSDFDRCRAHLVRQCMLVPRLSFGAEMAGCVVGFWLLACLCTGKRGTK
jgi:3-hydroxyisobutyrate dehydrogenase-like beta-hydroxyacid dehydrogenase